MPLQDIRHLIGAAPGLASVRKHALRLASLQKAFVENTPVELAELTKASRVGYIKAATLYLLADNAAAAAKLRQLLPRLLPVFQKLEREVTAIRVQVQVNTSRAAAGHGSGKLPPRSIQDIDSLTRQVKHPALREALAMISKKRIKSNT